ncbi:MAG: 3-dehydroquinate synthase [Gemmatimonadetes bacterium]|nr:3-dehydroquinate synthase [Gemmatimonadota bacterium]
MHSIWVRSHALSTDYEIRVEPGALDDVPRLAQDRVPAHRYAVIADETVAELYGSEVCDRMGARGMNVALFTFPPGERSKTRDTWARIVDAMVEQEFGRDSAVVAVGGGVTGDLAGFVAAAYMRGVPLIQVPTSLVAMIDASIGGKTGVDIPGGKNLVGAFHPPNLVLIDPTVLLTLPRRERAEGLAEAVKHGAIRDRTYFESIEATVSPLLDADHVCISELVVRSVAIKAEVVTRDERENGVRKILNFGHTIAHALEAATDYRVSHGAAVSIGMVTEARIGEMLAITQEGTARRLADLLARLELPTELPAGVSPESILRHARVDKKRRAAHSRYVLLRRLGEVAEGENWSHDVPDNVVREVLDTS